MTRALVLALLVFGVACGSRSETARAVRSTRLIQEGSPALVIPATSPSGDVNFGRATAAVRLAGGTIVVGDASDVSLAFFDSHGSLIRRAGRVGSGPGELRAVGWLGECRPDSLFVYDAIQRRIVVFDSTGASQRQVNLRWNPAAVRCSEDGVIAILLFPSDFRRPDPDGDSPVYRAPFLILNADGDSIASLGTVPVGENRPMGRVTRFGLADEVIYLGTAESASVAQFNVHGRQIGDIAIGLPPRPPSRTEYESAVDRLVAGFTDASYRETVRRQMLEIPPPTSVPAYTSILVDPTPAVWAEVSSSADSGVRFQVVSEAGERIDDVFLPGRTLVTDVGRDHLLGVQESADGVQQVVMYRVSRPSSGR